jgi:aldo/keto reductase family protein
VTEKLFPRASRLGFGCASLGSRVGHREGLSALAAAFEHGVNWFDLAPSYGDGDAESIFAQFAKGRRADIHISTKCGIEPPQLDTLQRMARPLARTFMTIAPKTREFISRSRRSAHTMPFSAELIRESLNRSLERLRTSYVDVYALHDPSPDDIAREDVHRQLEVVLSSGKVRAIGIAGSIEAIAKAISVGLPVDLVQIADRPFEGALVKLRAVTGPSWPAMLLTHSIFGRTNLIDLLAKRLGSGRRLREKLVSSGYAMPLNEAVPAFLLDCALARNRNGVVLLSMFSHNHLIQNLARTNVLDMNPIAKQLCDLLGATAPAQRDTDHATKCS